MINRFASHHCLTLGLGGKLYLAPIDKDKITVSIPFAFLRTSWEANTSLQESNRHWNWHW